MSSLRRTLVAFVLGLVATVPVAAQTGEGVDILLGKARSLEARGRMDLAAQNGIRVIMDIIINHAGDVFAYRLPGRHENDPRWDELKKLMNNN